MELALLVNRFNVKGRLVTLVPFGNGNINDTFLAVFRNTFTETQLVLQRVNRNVFPRPEQIMANMHAITLHCHEKLERDAASGRDDRVWQMPRIIKTKEAKDFARDENGHVCGLECVQMELGEPDESGRRRPIEKKGSNFVLDVDAVIIAIGTSPNPLLRTTTPGLEANKKGCIVADEKGATSREGVFAGGDAVTGAATVILAMGAGKKAAASIVEYLENK